jgi:hypothetical protein
MRERLKASKEAQDAAEKEDVGGSQGDIRTSQPEVIRENCEDESAIIGTHATGGNESDAAHELRTSQEDLLPEHVEAPPSPLDIRGSQPDERTSEDEGIISSIEDRSEHSEVRGENIELSSEHKVVRSSKLATRRSKRSVRASPRDVRSSEIDEELLDQAIALGEKNPKVTIFSPTASKVLQYLGLTVIKYSMSNDMRGGLEEAVMSRYPSLYKAVLRRESDLRKEQG